MTLIIPMSGIGKRFIVAGYRAPKPFIQVEGRPMIAHVLDMYPGEKEVICLYNKEHLADKAITKQFSELAASAKIIPADYRGDGPVPAIQQAYTDISDDKEIIVSYCDFTGLWAYNDFKKKVKKGNFDGAIIAYKGFHPHLLGDDFYGHMRVTDQNHMLEIKEKSSFDDDKMNEFGAVGSYWFKNGKIMKQYFDEAVSLGLKTGPEFFCSLPYNLMVRDGLKILVYEMSQFCQWGTPQDLEEYEAWSRAFAQLSGKPLLKGKTDIPITREPFVKARECTFDWHTRTFQYWQRYFSSVPWHPYKRIINDNRITSL